MLHLLTENNQTVVCCCCLFFSNKTSPFEMAIKFCLVISFTFYICEVDYKLILIPVKNYGYIPCYIHKKERWVIYA